MLKNLQDRLLGVQKPGIIFVHIPKTGGSSISTALRKHYRLSKFNIKSEATSLAVQKRYGITSVDQDYDETLQEFRLSLIFHEAQIGKRFITGHFWANENLGILKPLGYSIITCLRNPVDRWLSHFLYSRYKEGSYGRIEQDVEEFLESQQATAFATTYVRYFGGTRPDRDYTTRSAVEGAIANLDMFDIVGFLDRLDDFRLQVQKSTGFKLRSEHKRRSPADPLVKKKIKESREF
ncbi:MAG: sulfotransferase family 2 domain-containing protein [bacterium]|nr:sulfotransferase family 2 domain-containing protein [bacterium]MDT8365282.1 sulfotransferase family 2 domain-containing protein [bacterium]